MKYCLAFVLLISTLKTLAQHKPDAILGKWESVQKNLIVEIYKHNNAFKARIVWFHDADDTITPIEQRLDIKNPDKNLRSGKILGMDVLSGLVYDAKQNRWEKGRIYDSSSGKTWDATVWLIDANNLNVRGFYLVRLFGKTLSFTRIN